MDRRTFMKLLGGLASMPIIGRVARPIKSETVQEGIAAVSDKGMQLYEMVVAKVMKEGKKIGESGRVDSYKHPDRPDITVDVNQVDGSAEIYFDTDKGSKGYAKIDRDMETGGDELIEAEEVFNIKGDKDIEEGIRGGIENLDEFTRVKKNIGGEVQPYDPRASATDFARAIDQVGAGTNMQKARAIQEYDQNIQRQNMLQKFADHARVSEAMAGKTGMPVIPQYGFQTGYDFQKKFTGLDPKISAGLAAAYQTLQEGSRALNPFGDTFLRFPTAMKTAQQQATENIEGILAADTGIITPEQQAARNEYLESQGQPIDKKEDVSTKPITSADYPEGYTGAMLFATKPTMADVAGPAKTFTPDSEGYAGYEGILPGFKARKRSDGRLEYKAPDGQVYGHETYMSIAAGAYPNIYDPNKQSLKDGGSVDLTIISMPDISGSGVESLFKRR